MNNYRLNKDWILSIMNDGGKDCPAIQVEDLYFHSEDAAVRWLQQRTYSEIMNSRNKQLADAINQGAAFGEFTLHHFKNNTALHDQVGSIQADSLLDVLSPQEYLRATNSLSDIGQPIFWLGRRDSTIRAMPF